MNEFLEQFLLESRELLQAATEDLLALAQTPRDGARLDAAFRNFHTLKGAAGIMEFEPMARALHAAEDALSEARAISSTSPRLVEDCLWSLDRVSAWLLVMERTGEPPADAEIAADAIVARFAPTGAAPPSLDSGVATDGWLAALLADHGAGGEARAAVRYRPDADAFFRGEDPLAVIADLPGLLGLRLAPEGPWPSLETFDPFASQLVIDALSSADADTLRGALSALGAQVQVVPLAEGGGDLPAVARDLLTAQILLLDNAEPGGAHGRMMSAARTAANVLGQIGRPADAAKAGEAASRAELVALLEKVLAGDVPSVAGAEELAPAGGEVALRSLRVDVERLDGLVRLAGELTVAKNALGHAARLADDGADSRAMASLLKTQHALLERLTGELQSAVVGMRVVRLHHVFQRFPRLVHDMGATLSKPLRLVIEGADTEADKTIVEGLFEPLLHVLRNAADHGVEDAAGRAAAGKPASATIVLSARRQGDNVLVEIADDGRGVDVARIRQIAGERGLRSREALTAMDDAEVADLIFAPGFSTADTVTGLSGRGVGMDAVRTAVEAMGGRVGMHSTPGRGLTVRFTLPFTVMMSRLMSVHAGGQVFGLPLEAVVETVKIDRTLISPVGAGRAFVARDRTVPIIDLAGALGLEPPVSVTPEATIVITAVGGQLTGLEVDRVGERIDVMLKPMDGLLAGMPGVAGTTLLGDGRVLIVLDPQELVS